MRPEVIARASSAIEKCQPVTALASLSDEELANRDVAELNLICTAGLPGTEDMNIADCMRKLKEWAWLVQKGTQRMLPKFRATPRRYENCEARFRMLTLVTVLRRNLDLQYNLRYSEGEADVSDARNVSMHGILSGFGGTCATFPVLYVAIGRRLGYPLWLVPTREHLFCRWDDGCGTRFNIEATSPGFAPLDDDHFRGRPKPITDLEIRVHGFLRSMSPRRELADFIFSRAMCMHDNLMLAPCIPMFKLAADLTPDVEGYRRCVLIAAVEQRLSGVAKEIVQCCRTGRLPHLSHEQVVQLAVREYRPLTDWEPRFLQGAARELLRIITNDERRKEERERSVPFTEFTTTVVA